MENKQEYFKKPKKEVIESNNQLPEQKFQNIENNVQNNKDLAINVAINKFETAMLKYEKSEIQQLLSSHKIDAPFFVRQAINELKRNEKLIHAFLVNPKSIFASLFFAAEIGLIPSEQTGEFYLIPRNIKQSNGTKVATVTPLIGYKGIIKLLLRNGYYTKITSNVVYEGDIFEVELGTNDRIIHKPNYTTKRTADKIQFVYATSISKEGVEQFEVLTREQILAIKSMQYENELYFNDEKNANRWMERKCAIIQLSKLLNKDYYVSKAIGIDNFVSAGNIITLDENNKIELLETPQKLNKGNNILNKLSE